MCAYRGSLLSLLRSGRCRSVNTTSISFLGPPNASFLYTPLPLSLQANSARLFSTLSFRSPQIQSRTLFSSLNGSRHAGAFMKSPQVAYTGGASAPKKSQSYTEKVKVIMKEYGAVGVIFHTVISLFSLGTCYFLVQSGLDVDAILTYFNVDSSGAKKGASTFAIAYVFHKFLLPVRATITIVSVPVIVRSLRARGWMKGSVQKITKTVKQ